MRSKLIKTFVSAGIIASLHHTLTPAEVITDGSLGDQSTLAGPNYEITSDLGKIHGNNLYHSFTEFNLSSTESANFSGPGHVSNIISRVTGGNESMINGSINSSINGANLFLLNPNGIIFGANASINITGSFYASTADYLNTEGNERFFAIPNEQTVLSVSSPSAFGFLDSNIAPIKINGSQLNSERGKTMSIIGGDITITGRSELSESANNDSATLKTVDGNIEIASVASTGEIPIATLDTSDFSQLGNISVNDYARIAAQGSKQSNIVIRGGTLTIQDSQISSAYSGDIDSTDISVDIQLEENLTVESSNSAADLDSGIIAKSMGLGRGGEVNIDAGKIDLSNGAVIHSLAYTNSGADLVIHADHIALDGTADYSEISTYSFGSGDAGDLDISATTIQGRGSIDGGAYIDSSAFSESNGNSGDITIKSKSLDMYENALISSTVYQGSGSGGRIAIESENINFSGSVDTNGGIEPSGIIVYGKSEGVHVKAKSANFSDYGGIDLITYSDANAGNILIETNELNITNIARIANFSNDTGNAGNIEIISDRLFVSYGSVITSGGYGLGDAGSIDIKAKSIELKGPSPNIDQFAFTGIFAVGGLNGGNAGQIKVNSQNINVLDGAQIDTRTAGPGNGGAIDVIAENIYIAGYDPINDTHSRINASTEQYKDFNAAATGNGGQLNIRAKNITLQDNGHISVFSTSHGNSGSLQINTEQLTMNQNAAILANSSKEGKAGDIVIHSKDSINLNNSEISSHSNAADGGNVTIYNDNILYLENSSISTSVASSSGNGGKISIDSNVLVLNRGEILATASAGMGGDITITAQNILSTADSRIDATSDRSINGSIEISPKNDVISQIRALPDDILDVSKLFDSECGNNNYLLSSLDVKSIYNVTSNSISSNSMWIASAYTSNSLPAFNQYAKQQSERESNNLNQISYNDTSEFLNLQKDCM